MSKAIGLTYPLEISDGELSGRVLAALARDGQVQSDDLRVFVEDGVVTLLGTVDSPQERRRAQQRALSVAGVRRVDNRLTVAVDQYLSDDELLEQVRLALARTPALARYRLGARIEQGVVTLLGRVRTLAEEQTALRVAGTVKGIREVVSALEVGQMPPTGAPAPVVDDSLLRSEVNAAISAAGVTLYENASYVRDGYAYLVGLVDDRRTMRRAVEAAQQVPGLQGVRNRLVLRADPASEDPDEALTGRVVEALARDGRVSPSQVVPVASDGLVVLSGQVASIADHDAALAVARAVPGVQQVIDNVVIQGHPPLEERPRGPRRRRR